MDSLSFSPGSALLVSHSPASPWTAVFEDEGPAGYFYACDRTRGTHNEDILDAMLLYHTAALSKQPGAPAERLGAIEWSVDGSQAVFSLDGRPQALFDFGARRGYCRLDFPNFLTQNGQSWKRDTHAWSDAAFAQFEAAKFDASLKA
jgi:hypothetical protein